MNRFLISSLLLATLISGRAAQQDAVNTITGSSSERAHLDAPTSAEQDSLPNHVLGPEDEITVSVSDLDEFNGKRFRIDVAGDISLPIVGRIHASGMTPTKLEAIVNDRLRSTLNQPDAAINVSTIGSQPVSVLGSVNNPGIRQIEGQKDLFELLSLSGGLRSDAGHVIKISRDLKRGALPLANAKTDETGRRSIGSVRTEDILTGTNNKSNIVILPGDDISIPKGQVAYAIGSVVRPGGFSLNEHGAISVLQILSLAGGLQRTAAAGQARILRAVPGSPERVEIAVDVKKTMAGTGEDIQLKPDDILFVPNSTSKTVGLRTIEAMVSIATGAAMYNVGR